MLWEVDVTLREGHADRAAQRLVRTVRERGLAPNLTAATARGFLIESAELDRSAIERIAAEVLCDRVVEDFIVAPVDDPILVNPPAEFGESHLVQVMPKTGVMDPVALSAERAVIDLGFAKPHVRTLHKYWLGGIDAATTKTIAKQLLANDAIEQVQFGPLTIKSLDAGTPYTLKLRTTPLAELDDAGLMHLSKSGQLYLQLAEMQTIQKYFGDLGREPTDIELETIAQTWSEHCSHKTLAGRIAYRDEKGERRFENMLKETIFAATQTLRKQWGADDWCVSVFKDNAGIVKFHPQFHAAFKVETHNHPSALEPYGGANTGLGGVIRDTLGTGLGAKPVCSTDVFCFAPPNTPADTLPAGVLHPRRVLQGVVEGVRDYGNRMGIPTVNGAVCFDERYLGNPLVFCGNVGIIPPDKSFKKPQPNDLIVAIGGRTGRDGIHGATFSSAELTSESETASGGAVQIGNAIEEKKVQDVLLQARDRGLFSAVTDCGAGGFSSAVGEMGEKLGAEVWLDKAPLKYAGLSYTEIWISEAQERMVLSVPEHHWSELEALCAAEEVEATVLGKFAPTGRLKLMYEGQTVGDLPMDLLHNGRPPVVRQAHYEPKAVQAFTPPAKDDYTADLLAILGALNVASKEWIIRQYDHEVQGGSVVKPLVGIAHDGPSDAAVVQPVLGSPQGLVISCGINPCYGDADPYDMAASAIDEAIRNCVAVGADPRRIAVLDNFCWGDCEQPATLGSLVRAAIACHDIALVLGTPFISGKDSLNNEFKYTDASGERRAIAIPPTLLISALGQVADVTQCVTMDLKTPGNVLYLIGETHDEFGGSQFASFNRLAGGGAPKVRAEQAKQIFAAVHGAIQAGQVRACHDLSEGGLAVALAEMCFAGGWGAEIELPAGSFGTAVQLFSESNSRFVCEVPRELVDEFEARMVAIPHARLGVVSESPLLQIVASGKKVIDVNIAAAKDAWQAPLKFA